MADEKTLLRHLSDVNVAVNVTVDNIQEKVKEIIGCNPVGHYVQYTQKYTSANIEDTYTGVVVAEYEHMYIIEAQLPENRILSIAINKADIVCGKAKVKVLD